MNNCTNQDIERSIENAELICQDKKLRFSEVRKKVLKLILLNNAPSKAYDLLEELKKDQKTAQVPTIYRALDFLLDNGFIHRLNSLNAYVRCSHPLKHDQCYFLICKKCQGISECCGQNLVSVIDKTAKSNNFEIENVALEISGKCKNCQ